jgi:hypothetical protein
MSEEERMSDVIEFLEQLGRDAHLRHASRAEIGQALARSHIDPSVQAAILDEDPQQLEALLGADTNVCCMIFVPEDEDDAPPEEESVSNRSIAA